MRPVRYTWWLETGSIYLVAIGFSVDRCRGVDRLQRRFNERRRAVADTADFCDIAGSRLETGKPSATAGVLRSVGQSGLYVRRGRRIPNHVRMAGGSGSSSARCGKSHSFAYPVISPLRWLMQVGCSCYAFVSSLSRATRSCSSFALLMRYSNSRPL
jgi:hypothetical protein